MVEKARKNKIKDAMTSTLNNNFESNLKPFLKLFHLLGLHIPTGKINPGRFGYGGCAWVCFLIGGIFLLADFIYYAYASFSIVTMLSQCCQGFNGTNLTTATAFSFEISWFNTAGYCTISHLSVFLLVWLNQRDWKRLWINLQEIHLKMNLDALFYRRFKRQVWLSLTLLLMQTGYFFYPVTFTPVFFYWNIPWLYSAHITMLNFSNFVSKVILALFFVLVMCSSDLLTLLIFRAKLIIRQHQLDGNSSFLAVEIEKWRRHHLLVCQFIRWINNCFGPFLLLTTGNFFVSFIVNFYNIFEAVRTRVDAWTFFLSITALEVAKIFFFLYAPYKMKLSVIIKNISHYFKKNNQQKLFLSSFQMNKLSKIMFRVTAMGNHHNQILVNHKMSKQQQLPFFNLAINVFLKNRLTLRFYKRLNSVPN